MGHGAHSSNGSVLLGKIVLFCSGDKINVIPAHYHQLQLQVIIHGSSDFPRQEDVTREVGVGRVYFLTITGTRMSASKQLSELSVSQRKCIFPEEKNLRYFPTYSVANCKTECFIQTALEMCGCIPVWYRNLTKGSILLQFSKLKMRKCQSDLEF